ncbi:MAG: alanine racemase [Burkholderiaceae bacterium]|nr:alanine racemase [Burkholderiaceae bacterium]
MSRPLVATIDSAALQHNFSVVRAAVPKAKTFCVVKANAYGHGLDRAARAFAASEGLALIEIENAVHLREQGWDKPIVLLEGFFDPQDIQTIAAYGLELAVHCNEQIEMLEQAKLDRPLDIHLKMNTGMNRLGFKQQAWRGAYERLRALPTVRSIKYMTHFANGEVESGAYLPVAEQVRRFKAETAGLPGELNLSNSGAILLHPELATDWVRPGIMLYGGTPGGKTAEEYGLKPAMTLTSKIIAVQHIDKGDAIGYGSIFIADKPMTIGVVACGYADGYPRRAPEGTPILVDGIRTRVVGRVSMDMLTVDLTPVANAHVGSAVVIWGDGLPIEEVAQASGTVGYELMCALSLRVPVKDKISA